MPKGVPRKYPQDREGWIGAYQAAHQCSVEEATKIRDRLEKAWGRHAETVQKRRDKKAADHLKRLGKDERFAPPLAARGVAFGTKTEWTAEEAAEVHSHLTLTKEQEEFIELRSRGLTMVAAVEEMDRIRGIDRTRAARREMAYRLEEQTEIHQITMLGMHEMPDRVWEAKKQATLMNIAFRPGPNSGASIRAIELIDRLRFEHKFGTQEAVKRTLESCEARLKELDELERWGKQGLGEGEGQPQILGAVSAAPEDTVSGADGVPTIA